MSNEFFSKALSALNFSSLDSLASVNSISGLINVLESKAAFWRSYNTSNYFWQSRTAYQQVMQVLSFQMKTLSLAAQSTLINQAASIYCGALQTNHLLYLTSDSLFYKQESFRFTEQSKSLLLYESFKESDALAFANSGVPRISNE